MFTNSAKYGTLNEVFAKTVNLQTFEALPSDPNNGCKGDKHLCGCVERVATQHLNAITIGYSIVHLTKMNSLLQTYWRNLRTS